ncbi:KilA-N domain-containing protein [Methyloversatilis universalis]|uniref:KilA-N domain-containing protein n=1 Tax=Methyloversatilis universalis TaxID=378211 RepID=UPI0003816FD3|nr:KilA-N domain-containing protein [Methyloversatilis universalis]
MNSLITREHNGAAFTFREDGYFNMTKAAKHFGKVLSDFWRLQETAEYLDAMVVTTGIPLEILKQARCGGKGANVGTWAHPKLAVFFARWLDVRFAVWCDMQIDAGALPESACVHAG